MSFISRVIIGVTPFRVLITLLKTYLLSPLPLQVGFRVKGPGVLGGSWELAVPPTQNPQTPPEMLNSKPTNSP